MTARSMRRPDGPTELPGPDGDPAGAVRRLRWAILLNSLFVLINGTVAFSLRHGGRDLNLRSAFLHVVVEDQPLSSGGLLAERIRKELYDRFRISHATIQLEVALPAPADPLPIHHEGGTVRG